MTAVADDALPLQRLIHWETSAPARIAFTQPMGGGRVRDLTWAEVGSEVRRIAAYLKAQDFPPGSRIAILSKNCAHWMMSDFAIWLAGHVSVPLYPTLAPGTIRQILEHSESRLLFVGKLDGWEHMRAGVPAGLPCVSYPLSPANDFPTWDRIVRDTAPLQDAPMRPADEMSTIMYTSGTTGSPKGVMHSFATFTWSLATGIRRIPIRADDRILSYLPLAHVVERTLVEHGLLATGMHVYFAESLDTFAQDLQRARPTVFFSVPRLWLKFQQGVHAKVPPHKLQRLLGIPIVRSLVRRKILRALGLDRCRIAVGGAAPMPPDLLRWYSRLGLSILEGYGMTENCGVSHMTLPGVERPGTVGTPFDGVQSRVDPQTGEVQMKSAGLMLGYYKQPELTRATLTEDGWLRTGDKGQLDAEGHLRITGRVKDLFKTSKGKYVSPAPIEDRLVMHPAIEACVVAGADHAQPLGLIVLNADGAAQAADPAKRPALEASLADHLAQLNEVLDPHERLACLVVSSTPWTVDNDLITPTMKVKRNRVEDTYAAHYARWEETRQPVVWA
jgi:long-chain acyl-CoA synthetase